MHTNDEKRQSLRDSTVVAMQYAVMLRADVISDVALLQRMLHHVRHASGVMRCDDELADCGVLLVDFATRDAASAVASIDGVTAVEGMGVQHAT
jgi:hypothetical protein